MVTATTLGPEAQQLGGDLLVVGFSGNLALRGFARFQHIRQLQCRDQLVGSPESCGREVAWRYVQIEDYAYSGFARDLHSGHDRRE
jgi:hypothetical protein